MALTLKNILDDTRALDALAAAYIPVTGGTLTFKYEIAGVQSIKALGAAKVSYANGVATITLQVTGGSRDVSTPVTQKNPGIPKLIFDGEGFEYVTKAGKVDVTNLRVDIDTQLKQATGFSQSYIFADISTNGGKAVPGNVFGPTLGNTPPDVVANIKYGNYTPTWDLEALRPFAPAGSIPVQKPVTSSTPVVGGLTTITISNVNAIPLGNSISDQPPGRPFPGFPATTKLYAFTDDSPVIPGEPSGGTVVDKTATVETIRISELFGTETKDGAVLYHGGNFRFAASATDTTGEIQFQDLVADTRSNTIQALVSVHDVLNPLRGTAGSQNYQTDIGFDRIDVFNIGQGGSLTFAQAFADKIKQDTLNTISTKTVLGTVSFAPITVAPSDSVAFGIHQAYANNHA